MWLSCTGGLEVIWVLLYLYSQITGEQRGGDDDDESVWLGYIIIALMY